MSHFTDFTVYVLFIITSFLAGVESADQCLLNSKVLSCFSGVIVSIRSFFLLGSRLTYELTFANYSDVIKSTDPDATYTISNISLEFDTITNASLANQIRTEYMKSSILYDRILRACIIQLNKSDTSFSVDINSPSKSLKGVLLIFTQERSATKFARDTEEFYNPKITKVEVTVEGVANELYAQNMEYRHQYNEIVKHFAEGQLKEAGAI